MTRRNFLAGAFAALALITMTKKGKATLPTTHELIIEVRVQYTTADDEPLSTGHQNQAASAAAQGAAAKVSELGGEVVGQPLGIIPEG